MSRISIQMDNKNLTINVALKDPTGIRIERPNGDSIFLSQTVLSLMFDYGISTLSDPEYIMELISSYNNPASQKGN